VINKVPIDPWFPSKLVADVSSLRRCSQARLLLLWVETPITPATDGLSLDPVLVEAETVINPATVNVLLPGSG
jgi:hypothetical protein